MKDGLGSGGTVTDGSIFWSRWILTGISGMREEIVCRNDDGLQKGISDVFRDMDVVLYHLVYV